MPTNLENINTCIRTWLNDGLNIPLNKIIIANQNKQLPPPPYIFLILDNECERISHSEYTINNNKYFQSLFKLTISIEIIGINPLTHSIPNLITKLEKHYPLFIYNELGVIRDEIQIINVPNYFEGENETTKYIIDVPIYFVEKENISRDVALGVKFETNVTVYNDVATGNILDGDLNIIGNIGINTEGFGGELNITGVLSEQSNVIITDTTVLEGITGLAEYPPVETDIEINNTNVNNDLEEILTPPIIEITNITINGGTLTCT